jgi:hypothetical protein
MRRAFGQLLNVPEMMNMANLMTKEIGGIRSLGTIQRLTEVQIESGNLLAHTIKEIRMKTHAGRHALVRVGILCIERSKLRDVSRGADLTAAKSA